MDKIKAVFFKGWISNKSIQEAPAEWLTSWNKKALDENLKGNELIVFSVPKNLSDDIIADIETNLQRKIKQSKIILA